MDLKDCRSKVPTAGFLPEATEDGEAPSADSHYGDMYQISPVESFCLSG